MSKILIVTPTLGTRKTLIETCGSVQDFGGEAVDHVITCPAKAITTVSQMVGDLEVVEEKGKGVYGAVNHILKERAAKYEWVGYVNDDDYWLPSMSKLIQLSQEAKLADIVYGRVQFVDANGRPIMVSSSSAHFKLFPILAARGIIMFTQQAALIRSNLFLRLDGFDERYKLVADNDFWIRAITQGAQCEYVDAVCAGYRFQAGQLSSDKERIKVEEAQILSKYKLNRNSLYARLAAAYYYLENSKLYLERIFKKTNRNYTTQGTMRDIHRL